MPREGKRHPTWSMTDAGKGLAAPIEGRITLSNGEREQEAWSMRRQARSQDPLYLEAVMGLSNYLELGLQP